jgi:hypothetical protein
MVFENVNIGVARVAACLIDALLNKTPITTTTDTASADAVALTATPSAWVEGLIVGTPTAAMNLTTPTASQLINQFGNGQLKVGDSFTFLVRNASAGANAITLVAGTGVTLAAGNTNTVAQANTRTFLASVTAVGGTPTLTIYTLGTAAH